MAEDGYKVSLNVYDLSQGLARQLSTTFLGKVIEGIWHTGVVVYGNEYYFGGGIQHAPVGTTPYGTPLRMVELGVTHVPKELFEEYLQEISPRYTAETYSLLAHNCNNFSNEVAQFLVGATIPDYILQLPNEVLGSPMGPLILPMIQQLETTLRSGGVPHVPQLRPSPINTQSRGATTVDNSKIPVTSSSATRETPTSNAVESPKTNKNCMDSQPDSGGAPEKLPGECEMVPPAVIADSPVRNSGGVGEKPAAGIAGDPLGDARSRVQEEIGCEFAAIMATGTLRASEAAALATRRVMERYGRLNLTVKQG